MSGFLHDAFLEAMKWYEQNVMTHAFATHQGQDGTHYVTYEEVGSQPHIIDSTATVVDEDVKALPEGTSHE